MKRNDGKEEMVSWFRGRSGTGRCAKFPTVLLDHLTKEDLRFPSKAYHRISRHRASARDSNGGSVLLLDSAEGEEETAFNEATPGDPDVFSAGTATSRCLATRLARSSKLLESRKPELSTFGLLFFSPSCKELCHASGWRGRNRRDWCLGGGGAREQKRFHLRGCF